MGDHKPTVMGSGLKNKREAGWRKYATNSVALPESWLCTHQGSLISHHLLRLDPYTPKEGATFLNLNNHLCHCIDHLLGFRRRAQRRPVTNSISSSSQGRRTGNWVPLVWPRGTEHSLAWQRLDEPGGWASGWTADSRHRTILHQVTGRG